MAVEAINRKLALCLMSGGSTVPITTWLNDDGQECDPDEAVMAVAGPAADGRWHTLDLSEFDEVETQ